MHAHSVSDSAYRFTLKALQHANAGMDALVTDTPRLIRSVAYLQCLLLQTSSALLAAGTVCVARLILLDLATDEKMKVFTQDREAYLSSLW